VRPGLIFPTNRRFPRHDPRTIGRIVLDLEASMQENPALHHLADWLEYSGYVASWG
jgi:hypothetical protein